ncbi:hypothetical protein G6F59_017564 [Rhizopus arrhizus]|nr:hypothetical protein G6F59_017564 [Rhizopus arrhizus]
MPTSPACRAPSRGGPSTSTMRRKPVPAVPGTGRQDSSTSISATMPMKNARGAAEPGRRSDRRALTTKPSGASNSEMIDHGSGVPPVITSDGTMSLVSRRSVNVTHEP